MKYFYCDDNNVYTMIKYYDLYDNDCNINYPMFFKRKKIKESRKIVFYFRAYVMLSQRSVRSTSSVFFSPPFLFFILNFSPSISHHQFNRHNCIYGATTYIAL